MNYIASKTAPDYKSAKYWIDLSESPYGGIIKFWNGNKWDYVNDTDDLKELILNLQNSIKDLQSKTQSLTSSYNQLNSAYNQLNSKYTALEKRVAALEVPAKQ